jgi:muramoyltetrapeptide carboxypeptidase
MAMPLIKPPALRPGDTIGIAAPGSPFDRGAFEQGVAVLEDMGFRVKIPDDVFKKEGYLAGSDTERAETLMALFEDEEVKTIFCARGGFGSMRLLPLLNMDRIRSRPKILLGFSDVTALLLALYEMCGLVTFHGPMVTTLGKGSERTREALVDCFSHGRPVTLRASSPVVLHPGKASGPVLGGNLTSLTHLLGTPYLPSFEGHLLFLEDRGEAPYRIDRMLSQLRLGGHLEGLAGVIMGSFEDCGPVEEVYAIVKEAFRGASLPIVGGFPVGHRTENILLPLGLRGELDGEEGSVRFSESAVSEESL